MRDFIAGIVFAVVPALSFAQSESIDLLSFSQGAVPVAVTSAPSDLRIEMDLAIGAINGNGGVFSIVRRPATIDDVIEITYSLPAATEFDAFLIPNILETRSPSQTFVGRVEVLGSDASADGPFDMLAEATLQLHEAEGEVTELSMVETGRAVRWVKLRLSGGTDLQVDKHFLEFSEIVGHGTQADVPLVESFGGVYSGRGVKLELAQDGPLVSGCYDGTSMLTGTVSGNILRALGQDPAGIPSQFILVAGADGGVRGLRSSNGAPFRIYDGAPSDKAATCLVPEAPALGCGSIIHGIEFDFDSDQIRPSSQGILEDLRNGLREVDARSVRVIGHSSSEGAADYNRDLSQRRAQSVVRALTALGYNAEGIGVEGRGEDDPIASNDDEAGRSLNRRVEIVCSE